MLDKYLFIGYNIFINATKERVRCKQTSQWAGDSANPAQ